MELPLFGDIVDKVRSAVVDPDCEDLDLEHVLESADRTDVDKCLATIML